MTTNPNDPANYVPIKTEWEVQGKMGRGWSNLGEWTALSDLAACRKAKILYHFKTLRVRPASSLGVVHKWRRFSFKK
jgi:hypothetical protein